MIAVTVNGPFDPPLFETFRIPIAAMINSPMPPANNVSPMGTRRRGTRPSGRRPPRAAITGTLAAVRAGT